ncbi:hypothetical protein [Pedobacter miscanthi]|uniref:Uncharacterized protein n=1 Tax=Pedobacter miscanthi TaxID=2259170 RepID=A0A366LDY9_9SPHI|nr:hypothetical protein [Pedobacter miscanthi]RBQ11494.1 hypothetical protein DRW42_03255 [Pedobacter miscanthi]
MPYPLNIIQDFNRLKKQLESREAALELVFLQEEERRCLVTVKTFDTGRTLFYLPVSPLYALLKSRKQKAFADLLLSVMAYLYQITGVPHFREDYVYLEGIYGMIEEWVTDDDYSEDKQERQFMTDHFEMMYARGDYTLGRMSAKKEVMEFEERVRRFKAKTQTETDLLDCANKLVALQRDYPDRSVMERMRPPIETDYDDGYIRAEQYLCFYWSGVDCLQDHLFDTVNAELNEYGVIEEPVSIQFFESRQEYPLHDMDYERRLFEILHGLSDVLYDLEHGEPNG